MLRMFVSHSSTWYRKKEHGISYCFYWIWFEWGICKCVLILLRLWSWCLGNLYQWRQFFYCASLILKILMHAVFTVSWIHSVLKNMFSFELIPTKGKLVSWVFVLHLFGNAKKNFKFLVVKCKWYICIREIHMYLQVFWFESLHKL